MLCSLAVLALMGAIRMSRLKGMFRTLFLGLGTFLMLRYLFWRFTSTIPSLDAPGDFIAGMILLSAECYCALMMFLSLFTVADPVDRQKAPAVQPDQAPSVDVFVPSYNESTAILATTLAAAKRMIYPEDKLNVFLLDDGGTDQKIFSDDPEKSAAARLRRRSLQALCHDLDVTYLTRKANVKAKAGNLNNGLMQSKGDLVVVFDADHAPSREFLEQTIGFFSDPKLFLVQTPHFFLNVDPIEKNLGLRHAPAENEMFYSVVQKGLDKWNAAFFCGSAAVMRRTALDEVDGFHGSSITEDAETALELHSRGWKSKYVDRPMIAGLQPETFESFISQRSRWCQGMVQILLLKNPLFKRGLSLAQRLCYLSSCLFWLFPLPRMIFVFTPLCFILFGMKIYVANQQEFFAYTAVHLVASALIQSYVFGRTRWPWTSDVYEYIQSVQLFRALISVFISPKQPKFDVTAKGVSLDDEQLSSLARPYFAIFAIVAASLAVLVVRYIEDVNSRELLTVIGFWTVVNLGMSGIALGAVCERRERRGLPRLASSFDAALTLDGRSHRVTVTDISFGGVRVKPAGRLLHEPGSAGILRMATAGQPDAVWATPVVAFAAGTQDGEPVLSLKFVGSDVERYRIVAHAMFANVFASYDKRRQDYRSIGIVRASAILLACSCIQTVRGIRFAIFGPGKSLAPLASVSAFPDSAKTKPHSIDAMPDCIPEALSA